MTGSESSSDRELAIDTLALGSGQIGMLACPGRREPDSSGPDGLPGSPRELEADLERVCAWGATQLVTLLHGAELGLLGVQHMEECSAHVGLAWMHMPIVDGGVPDAEFERRWHEASMELQARLNAGQRIAVHCRAGLGRTGLFVARLLVDYGAAPADAMERVRAARPGAIETRAQERYLLGLRKGR